MKKIAPIIITILISCYLIFFFVGITSTREAKEFNFIIILVTIVVGTLLFALIFNLVKRLIEIDKENEDDISKY